VDDEHIGKSKRCGHCVVSVLTIIDRYIINVCAEDASSDEDEPLQPRTDCDIEENSILSFSPQQPALKDPRSVMKIKPTRSYEGM
jgi:hypothetical protein